MRKIILLLIPILCLLGCSKNSYIEINYKKMNQMFEEKNDFILFIGATSCSHCDTYKVTLKEIVKTYDIKIYYIDIDALSETERNDLKRKVNYSGTPTTVFIKKGKEESVYNRIVGDRSFDYIANKLKQNGYIEKVK